MNLLSKATNSLSNSQVATIHSQFTRMNKQKFQESKEDKSVDPDKKDHRAMVRLRRTLQTTMRRNAVNTKSQQTTQNDSPKRKGQSIDTRIDQSTTRPMSKENQTSDFRSTQQKMSGFGQCVSKVKFKDSCFSPSKLESRDTSMIRVNNNCGKSTMNSQTSMVRSKQFLSELEKKMQTKSLSNNTLKLSHNPSSIILPGIRKLNDNLVDSQYHEDLFQSSFINPQSHTKESGARAGGLQNSGFKNQISWSVAPGPGLMDSNVLMIHVDSKPNKTILLNPFPNIKTERQLQLKQLINFGRNSSRIVDNVYIRSLFENKVRLNSRNDLEKIKSTINSNFDENLSSMQHFASTICRRTRKAVQKIIQPSQVNKKEYKTELIHKMKNFLLFFKTLGLSSSELLKFPIRPYYHPKAAEFVKAAKFGDSDKITSMLFHHSNLLIYEFDYLHLTALHWATKRNHTECAQELIKLRAYVNSQDLYGRRPLYYAIQNKNAALVYQFLVHYAIPWSTENCNYIELADGEEIIVYLIKRFRYLDLILRLLTRDEREQFRKSFIETKIRRLAFARIDLVKNF
jgi:hypothetical protein